MAADLARDQRNPAAMFAGWKCIATMLGFMATHRHQFDDTSMFILTDGGRTEAMTGTELMAVVEQG